MKNFQVLAALLAASVSGEAGTAILVDGVASRGGHQNFWSPDAEGDRGSGLHWLNAAGNGPAYDVGPLYATLTDGKLSAAPTFADYLRPLNPPDSGRDHADDLATRAIRDVSRPPASLTGWWNVRGDDPANNPYRMPLAASPNGDWTGGAPLWHFPQGGAGGGGATLPESFDNTNGQPERPRLAGTDDFFPIEIAAADSPLLDPGQQVPEPGSLALLAAGLFGVLRFGRRAHGA